MKKLVTFMLLGCASIATVSAQQAASRAIAQPTPFQAVNVVKAAKATPTQKSSPRVFNNLPDGQKKQIEGMQQVRFQKGAYTINIKKVRQSARVPEGKAQITVYENMDWGDGTGYQLLLDADANTYGVEFGVPNANGAPTPRFSAENYDSYEYKLPENADYEATNVMLPGTTHQIEINSGVYDFVINNPSEGVYYTASNSMQDDYEFVSGGVYEITISQNGSNDNTVINHVADLDLGVANVTVDGTVPYTDPVTVKAEVENLGQNVVSSYSLQLIVDGEAVAEEVVNQALEAGSSYTHTFATTVDLSAGGKHIVAVKVIAEGDGEAGNDTAEATVFTPQPFSLPMTFDFAGGADVFAGQFNIIDANEDGRTWMYAAETSSASPAERAYFGYNSSMPMDDYLVTMSPAIMNAGEHYVSLIYKARSSSYAESFKVLYGPTNNPAEMTELGGATTSDNADHEYAVNFNVAEAGQYYFAVYACSEANMFGMSVDDFTIAEGTFIGTPNAILADAVLPEPATNLTSFAPEVVVSNNGSDAIASLTLTIKVNGEEFSNQDITLATPIAVGEEGTIVANSTIDMSAVGAYEVEVSVSNVMGEQGKPEENVDDNDGTFVTHHMGEATIPFDTDYTGGSADYSRWASLNDGWNIPDNANYLVGKEINLISAALPLEAGKSYRFGTSLIAGYNLFGLIQYNSSFEIRLGEAGTPVDEWEVVAEAEDLYYEEWTEMEFDFTAPGAGNYQLAVVPTLNGSLLGMQYINVGEILPYDLRVTAASSASQIPLAQAVPFPTNVTYVNKGTETSTFNFTVTAGDDEIGTLEVADVATGETDVVAVMNTPVNPAVGQNLELAIDAEVAGHPEANVVVPNMYPVAITDSIFAIDRVTEDMLTNDNAIGSSNRLGCGQLFTLNTDDVITGVQVLWAGDDADATAGYAVYKVNEDGTIDLMVEGNIEKEAGAYVGNYSFPAVGAAAGDYLVFAFATGYQFSADRLADGVLYVHTGTQVGTQAGLGNPGIRMILGEGEPAIDDVAAVEISKPGESMYVGMPQEVVALVQNVGGNNILTNVTLSVDGTEVESKELSLDPYQKQNVTFTAIQFDAVGTHTLTVTANLGGDTDPENNTVSKQIEVKEGEAADVLNFEACDSWSITDLNPAWTMEDRDGADTYGFQGITFPNAYGKMAYIVFAPNELEGLNEATAAALTPYEGEKFGASFAATGVANNDWLISPMFTLTSESSLTFAAKSFTDNYGSEAFNVLVKKAGEEEFTQVFSDDAVPTAWTEYTVDLSAYADETVNVAIQCVSNDQFIFMIDDIKVNGIATGVNDVTTGKTVSSVKLYNVAGQEVANGEGVTIQVTTYTDGTRVAKKVMK